MLGLVTFAAVLSPARGISLDWAGSFTNSWNTNINWSPKNEPTSGDTVNFNGIALIVLRTSPVLDANSTIQTMNVHGDHFTFGAWSFKQINGAVLTVTDSTNIGLPTTTTPSTTSLDGFLLNTHRLQVGGQMTAVITGNANVTTTGSLSTTHGSVLNLNSGSLNLAANTSHDLNDTSTLNVSGGTLNLGTNATLNAKATSTLNFSGGYNVTNNALLRAQGGGDIVSTSFIDVGNGGAGFLTVNQAGSTITAQSNISDWGRDATGRAVVDIFTGGTTTVSALRLGTSDAQASLNVSGGTLNVNSTFQAGGGAVSRSVQTTVQDSGTMTVNGAATFNNQADVNLVSGTLDFNNIATFNAGSRFDITGGTLDTTNQSLTINGGTLTRSTSGALSSGSALRVQAGGTATFDNFFDIGSGNSAALTVTGTGSTFTAGGTTDWGFGSGGATVSIDNNGVANFNSLRIGSNNGAASVVVASGGWLVPKVLTVGGGSNNRTVSLTINSNGTVFIPDPNAINTFNDKAVLNLQGGTFDPTGNVTFFTGSTANISSGGFNIRDGKTLTLQGGVINRTDTTTTGQSFGGTMAINSAGRFESVGSVSVGQFEAWTINVDGTNSLLSTRTDLNLGGLQAAQVGTITTTNGGRILVGDASNLGGVFAANDMFVSDLDAPAANAGGSLRIHNASVFNYAGNICVANQANHFGKIEVSGTNSRLTASGLVVIGRFGNGTADVLSGGELRSNGPMVQSFDPGSNSTINVTGPSSLMRADGNLVVGRAGNAVLNISAGGRAESGGITLLGEVAGGSGAITITGANSRFNATSNLSLDLGSTVTITSGGSLSVGGSASITGNASSINLQTGGTLSTQNFQSNGGNFNWTGGTLDLTSGLINLGGPLLVPGGGTLKGAGTITGNLAFGSGGSYGTEINATSGSSDQFMVTGTVNINSAATLTGVVTGNLVNGQKYFIVVNDGTDAVVGNFSGLTQGALFGTFGGIALKISYIGDSASGTITGGNDIVLYADSPYNNWSGGAPFDGDANGDGVSNGLAFLLGAPHPNAPALALLPTVTGDASGLVLTFEMLNAAARGGATLSVEHSSDLGIGDLWTTVAVPDATGGPTGGVTFTITGSNPLEVTATISASQAASGQLFGRLKAVNP